MDEQGRDTKGLGREDLQIVSEELGKEGKQQKGSLLAGLWKATLVVTHCVEQPPVRDCPLPCISFPLRSSGRS